jgi:hypothetical protein
MYVCDNAIGILDKAKSDHVRNLNALRRRGLLSVSTGLSTSAGGITRSSSADSEEQRRSESEKSQHDDCSGDDDPVPIATLKLGCLHPQRQVCFHGR